MAQSEYVFQRVEDQRELERLRMIEQVFDPASRRRLLGTGLQAGWRCLEVGPGAGSIMTWMGEVVGPTGQVVAVDLDPKFLSEAERTNLSVIRADIRTAQLPQQSFDVVHARYVLIHLPDYEVALTKMVDSLKPGGWLVLEEPDFSASRGITGDEQELASLRKVNQAIEQMYATLRMDYAMGLKLPVLMQRRGLQHLTVENDAPLCAGGAGMATVMKMSTEQLREKYLATGVVRQSDLERYCRFADDPNSWAIYYATIAVSGRKVGE
jgi:ubiquinone/menaquinone biosynthesis C-methylase UbiE